MMVDTSDDTNLRPCTVWNETEQCINKHAVVTAKQDITDFTFILNQVDCEGEPGVEIQLVETSSDELNKTDLYLKYKAFANQAVGLRASPRCFRTKKNLCGPDSISFFSDQLDFVMTNCNGSILMRKEYDYCG